MAGVLGKHQIEKALYEEKQEISSGRLKEDNPLDTSAEFQKFCEAARRGDLKVCQEQISKGININARDEFDYTPLILASLCGHYEVVQMLLEQGALCERDTFQGERCLYNALNDRIRNLLLSYDYSKSTDPLQPLAAHITGLLQRGGVDTTDISVFTEDEQFDLHKFVLSARSPFFARKLSASPETTNWRISTRTSGESFGACIGYLYIGDVDANLGSGEEDQNILTGIDKMSRQLEIPQFFENLLSSGDRRQARQRRTEEIERARDQLSIWFKDHVLQNKLEVRTDQAKDVKWDRQNGVFADVLLCADYEQSQLNELDAPHGHDSDRSSTKRSDLRHIPIGSFEGEASRSPSRHREKARSVLYPCHRAMLQRSEMFAAMFASPFREGQQTEHLQIIPVDCTPPVLEIILTFLYTEQADFSLSMALDVLHAADMLFIEKLKQRAALLISTLGNGSASVVEAKNSRGEVSNEDIINIYDVVRAGWDTRVHRLEEFGARYIAYRLERYIDEEDFRELVRESASRIQARQETDSVELVDDILFFLEQRFRLRFEESGLQTLMETEQVGQPGHDRGAKSTDDEGYGGSPEAGFATDGTEIERHAVAHTLEGELAGDEFAQDAIKYRTLLDRVEDMMNELGL